MFLAVRSSWFQSADRIEDAGRNGPEGISFPALYSDRSLYRRAFIHAVLPVGEICKDRGLLVFVEGGKVPKVRAIDVVAVCNGWGRCDLLCVFGLLAAVIDNNALSRGLVLHFGGR